jgi:Flp pilus assembly protein TadD
VGSREEADREFERALQLRPMFPEPHANLRKLQSR